MRLWDPRVKASSAAAAVLLSHAGWVSCVRWVPHSPHHLWSAGHDNKVPTLPTFNFCIDFAVGRDGEGMTILCTPICMVYGAAGHLSCVGVHTTDVSPLCHCVIEGEGRHQYEYFSGGAGSENIEYQVQKRNGTSPNT